MTTAETRVKNKLNTRDKNIEKQSKLPYRRVTFGTFSSSGLPDRLVNFGVVQIGVEVKRDGQKLAPLQAHRLEEMLKFGTPGMGVIGDEGVKSYYSDLLELMDEGNVERYLQEYKKDADSLREALKELSNGQ